MGCCVSFFIVDQNDDFIFGKNIVLFLFVVDEEIVVKEVLFKIILVIDNMMLNKVFEDKEKKFGVVNVVLDFGLIENGLVKLDKGLEICSLSENLFFIVNECNEEEVKQRKL